MMFMKILIKGSNPSYVIRGAKMFQQQLVLKIPSFPPTLYTHLLFLQTKSYEIY